MKKDIYFILFVVVIGTFAIFVSGKRGGDAVLVENVKKKESYQNTETSSSNFKTIRPQGYNNQQSRSYGPQRSTSSYDDEVLDRIDSDINDDSSERFGRYDRPLSDSLNPDQSSSRLREERTTIQETQPKNEQDDWREALEVWEGALRSSIESPDEITVLPSVERCSFFLRVGQSKALDVSDVSSLDISMNQKELTLGYSSSNIVLPLNSTKSAIYTRTQLLIGMCR